MTCDPPNEHIYDFTGESSVLSGKEVKLSNKNLLLRGMKLSFATEILGYVVYTGHESKIVKNEGKPVYKTSRIMDRANRNMIFIVLLQAIIALCCGYTAASWAINNKTNAWYL